MEGKTTPAEIITVEELTQLWKIWIISIVRQEDDYAREGT